jgi:hypothetical protein
MSGHPESLFGDLDQFTAWWAEWQGMPEYVHEDLTAWKSVVVHFRNRTDLEEFSRLVGQKISLAPGPAGGSQWIWFPKEDWTPYADRRYADA